MGWAMAVYTGVLVSTAHSGAHLNPAVTIALLYQGKISISEALIYIPGQMTGGMLGALLVFIFYRDHYKATEDKGAKLATFCTGPAIRNTINNLFSETIGTFVLVFAVLQMSQPEHKLGALDALPVALVILGIGLCLGGTTGYALNPARDLGPRLMHHLLPVPDKGSSDWNYSWVPVIGPIIGGIIAAALHGYLS
jgi:glycerol uptake facilitator protein